MIVIAERKMVVIIRFYGWVCM